MIRRYKSLVILGLPLYTHRPLQESAAVEDLRDSGARALGEEAATTQHREHVMGASSLAVVEEFAWEMAVVHAPMFGGGE